MDLFKKIDLTNLLAESAPPCVSVFMPTHRASSEQDPIRLRTNLTQARDALIKAGKRASDVEASWRRRGDFSTMPPFGKIRAMDWCFFRPNISAPIDFRWLLKTSSSLGSAIKLRPCCLCSTPMGSSTFWL